jgi:hypothetical protein
MSVYVNCDDTGIGAEALLRLMVVDSDGEPYFDECSDTYISKEDLAHLLIGEDSDGNPALRVYQEP